MSIADRPVVSSILFDESGNAVKIGSGFLVTAGPELAAALGVTSGLAGIVSGYVTTSATSIVAVRGSIFNEQSSAAQRSVVSSSASDSSAGTGARTVRITYFDGSMAGPYTEDVTLNGTTAVNTVATNIRFVESFEVLTVGSGGVNAGNVDLTISTGGGGGSMGRINASEGRTYWCHHYVGAGRTAVFRHFDVSSNGVSTQAWLRAVNPITANAFEKQLIASLRAVTAYPPSHVDLLPMSVQGPARVTAYVRPDASTASTMYSNLSYVEY